MDRRIVYAAIVLDISFVIVVDVAIIDFSGVVIDIASSSSSRQRRRASRRGGGGVRVATTPLIPPSPSSSVVDVGIVVLVGTAPASPLSRARSIVTFFPPLPGRHRTPR
jgi:hypothetical protein